MTRAAAQRLAWVLGGSVLVAALFASPDGRPLDATLWMAAVTYVLGFHWIVAYCFGGTMYGALRLQPQNRVARTGIFAFGLLLVFFAMQFLLGYGGPLA